MTINPLGFALERFDAVGRTRESDRGKPIDDSTVLETLDGKKVRIEGAQSLGAYLAGSEEAHAAFVEKLFLHLVKQPMLAYGADRPAQLTRFFRKNDFNIQRLIVEIISSVARKDR